MADAKDTSAGGATTSSSSATTNEPTQAGGVRAFLVGEMNIDMLWWIRITSLVGRGTWFVRAFLALAREKPAETIMFIMRFWVVLYAIGYMTPLVNQYTAFRRAMTFYAIASAIRAYQRRPPVDSVMEFVKGPKSIQLFLEDSVHNLIYGLVLMPAAPTFVGFVSPAIFSFFQSTVFLNKIFERVLPSRHLYLGQMLNRVASQDRAQQGFQLAAKSEIILLFVLLFEGATSFSLNAILRGLMYAQFCVMRILSKRNPHPRQAWYAFRLVVESIIQNKYFPEFGRVQINKLLKRVDELSVQLHHVLQAVRQQEQQQQQQ